MGQSAKPLDRTPTPTPASGVGDDPFLAAFLSSPLVEFSEEEQALIDEGKRLHTHYITTEEMMAAVNAMRPADATDDLDDE